MTLVELLTTLAIIVVLTSILLAAISQVRVNARAATCLSQLHQIATALGAYSHDNIDQYPDPLATQSSWEQSIRYYVSNAAIFKCPADQEIFPVVGSSYDWRDTGQENTTLAGRTAIGLKCSDPILVFDALPGWHVSQKINVARVDGSASMMDQDACVAEIQRAIR